MSALNLKREEGVSRGKANISQPEWAIKGLKWAKSALSPGMCCVKAALTLWRWHAETRPDRTRRHFLIDNQYFIHTGIYIYEKILSPRCLPLAPLHIETECKEDESVCANFLPVQSSEHTSDCWRLSFCVFILFPATHLFLGSQSAH